MRNRYYIAKWMLQVPEIWEQLRAEFIEEYILCERAEIPTKKIVEDCIKLYVSVMAVTALWRWINK